MALSKKEKRIRRHKRVRAKIKGTAKVPRLCVFRSNKRIEAQLIDDAKGKTIAYASDKKKLKNKNEKLKVKEGQQKTGKILQSFEVGKEIAKKALENNIKAVVFDRGGYKYHGRVKALAEGARAEGLLF